MSLFLPSGGVPSHQEPWTQQEIRRLEAAWSARVPHSELTRLFPGRSKGAIVMMASRLGLERGSGDNEYLSLRQLMDMSKMSRKTILSILEYSNLYDVGVRTEGTPPRIVFHKGDAEHAILRWIDLMSLLQYAEYVDRPYSTLQHWMKRRGITLKQSVDVGHRRLHPMEWARVFDGDLQGLEFMFDVTPPPTR